MNNDDLQKLKAAATAVENHGVIRSMALPTSEILALIAEVEQARTVKQEPIILAPKWAGEFNSYQHWVNKGSSWLASPDHRRAMCVDSIGRRVATGADFMRARDEKTFPVRFFWECEPVTANQAPPAVENGWLPIETAPKDGTPILVLKKGFHPAVARWREDQWMTANAEANYSDGQPCYLEWDLTHWQPLPASPQ